jgi:hypothetical protein
MNETLRRLILGGSLLVAIWLAAYTRPAAIALREADLQKRYERKARLREGLTFDAFLAEETGGTRSVRREGKASRDWRDQVGNFLAGGASDRDLKRRTSRGYLQDTLYFDIDDPRMAKEAACLGSSRPHVYVEFDGDGPDRFLSATRVTPADGYHDAPAWLIHPLQSTAFLVFIAGLIGYIALPWKRPGGDRFMHNRLQGAVLPDIVGMILGGGGFALPLFVCTRDTMMSRVVIENGYAGVTLVALAASVFGLVTWGFAAATEAFEIRVFPDRLRIIGLRNSEEYLLADIAGVEAAEYQPPRWLRIVYPIALLFGRPSLTAGMSAGMTTHSGLRISTRDGRSRRFALTGFSGADRLLLLLRDAGVAVSQDALAMVFEEEPVPDRVPPATPARSAARWQASSILVVLALGFAATTWHRVHESRWESTPLPRAVEPPSLEAVAARSRILEQMKQANAAMRTAMKEAEATSGPARQQAIDAFTKAQSQFNTLHEAFERTDDGGTTGLTAEKPDTPAPRR